MLNVYEHVDYIRYGKTTIDCIIVLCTVVWYEVSPIYIYLLSTLLSLATLASYGQRVPT
jgi:hypothetical protein